jgi:transcriptional regulator with XRE-family HTH domain
MNEATLFGGLLRATREAHNLSLVRLAELAGTDPKHLGRIERGEKLPSFKLIVALANAIPVSPSVFFEFEEAQVNEKAARQRLQRLLEKSDIKQLRKAYKILSVALTPWVTAFLSKIANQWSIQKSVHSDRSLPSITPPMRCSNIVRVVISPSTTHPFRFVVIGDDIVVIGELFVADCALLVLLDDLAIQQFSHFGGWAQFAIASRVMWILNPLYSEMYKSRFGIELSSATRPRVMNRTNFVRSQSHGFSPERLLMTLKDEWKVLWTELGQ